MVDRAVHLARRSAAKAACSMLKWAAQPQLFSIVRRSGRSTYAKIDPLRAQGQPIESISWVAQLLFFPHFRQAPRLCRRSCPASRGPATTTTRLRFGFLGRLVALCLEFGWEAVPP